MGALAFAAIVGSVQQPIALITALCCPAQMTRRNTTQVAIAARMGGVVLWSWRGSMPRLANKAAYSRSLSVYAEHTVSLPHLRVRPEQAVIARVANYDIAQIGSRFSVCRTSCFRRT